MNRVRGFTLIELMVVVAIIGVTAAVAIPSYTSYILKSHRSAAINGVLDLASRQARYYTTNNTYSTSMTVLGYPTDPMPIGSSQDPSYNLSVASANATAFSVQAVPVDKQTRDACGTYTYSDMGVKGISAGTVKECWKQ